MVNLQYTITIQKFGVMDHWPTSPPFKYNWLNLNYNYGSTLLNEEPLKPASSANVLGDNKHLTTSTNLWDLLYASHFAHSQVTSPNRDGKSL